MNKVMASLSVAATLFVSSAFAQGEEGKVIFESKGCALCHKKDVDTIGPALRTIAKAYSGKEMTLIIYLQGNGTAIVEPDRAVVMNPQLVKTRVLLESERKALAEYIVSASDRPF